MIEGESTVSVKQIRPGERHASRSVDRHFHSPRRADESPLVRNRQASAALGPRSSPGRTLPDAALISTWPGTAAGRRGQRDELTASTAAYGGLPWDEVSTSVCCGGWSPDIAERDGRP